MPFGLDLSTLGNLGRAASKGIADNKAFNDEQRVLGQEDADRELSKLTIKTIMDPSPENQQALMSAIQSSKASPRTIAQLTPVAQQIAQLPAKMEAERLQKEQDVQAAPFERAVEKGKSAPVQDTFSLNQQAFGQLGADAVRQGTEAGLPELMQAREATASTVAEQERLRLNDPKNFKAAGDGQLTNVLTGDTVGGARPQAGGSGSGGPNSPNRRKVRIMDAAIAKAEKGINSPSQVMAEIEQNFRTEGIEFTEEDREQAFERVKPMVLRPLKEIDADTSKKIQASTSIQKAADTMLTMLEDPTKRQALDSALGTFRGRATQVRSWLTGGDMDDSVEDFLFFLGVSSDVISRMRSGAALTESERVFYGKLLGDQFTSPNRITRNLTNAIAQLESEKQSAYRRALAPVVGGGEFDALTEEALDSIRFKRQVASVRLSEEDIDNMNESEVDAYLQDGTIPERFQ